MKKLILSAISMITTFYSLQVHALHWEIYGACSNKPQYAGEYNKDSQLSIGEITVAILEANKIPYTGSELNIASIANSPTGLDAMEVISDREMRAYGWCYSVNGVLPNEMPNHVYPSSPQDKLVWFYGYYTNKDNVWSGPCLPSYDIKAEQFCGK